MKESSETLLRTRVGVDQVMLARLATQARVVQMITENFAISAGAIERVFVGVHYEVALAVFVLQLKLNGHTRNSRLFVRA
jgi:hypothetical protein